MKKLYNTYSILTQGSAIIITKYIYGESKSFDLTAELCQLLYLDNIKKVHVYIDCNGDLNHYKFVNFIKNTFIVCREFINLCKQQNRKLKIIIHYCDMQFISYVKNQENECKLLMRTLSKKYNIPAINTFNESYTFGGYNNRMFMAYYPGAMGDFELYFGYGNLTEAIEIGNKTGKMELFYFDPTSTIQEQEWRFNDKGNTI